MMDNRLKRIQRYRERRDKRLIKRFDCTLEWGADSEKIESFRERRRQRLENSKNSSKIDDNSANLLTKGQKCDIIKSSGKSTRADGKGQFIKFAYAVVQDRGIDTEGMEPKEVIELLEADGVNINDLYQDHLKQLEERNQRRSERNARNEKYKEELADKIHSVKEARDVYRYLIDTNQLKPTAPLNLSPKEISKRKHGKVILKPKGGKIFPGMKKHFDKHGEQKAFAGMTDKQYQSYAAKLAQSEVNKKIDGFMRSNGDVVRYDTAKNTLVSVSMATQEIRTCHELDEARYSDYRPSGISGRVYFELQKLVNNGGL